MIWSIVGCALFIVVPLLVGRFIERGSKSFDDSLIRHRRNPQTGEYEVEKRK